MTAASAQRVSVVPASSWVGEGTSISAPSGSCSNAIRPASRPPLTAMTASLASAIVPTSPGDEALCQTRCPEATSIATRRPSPSPSRTESPETTGELRSTTSFELVAPRAPAVGGIQPVQAPGDVRREHALRRRTRARSPGRTARAPASPIARTRPSASRARTRRSAEPMNSEPPPAEGAVPAVEFAWIASAGHDRSPVASSNAPRRPAPCRCSGRPRPPVRRRPRGPSRRARPSARTRRSRRVSSETAYTVPSWSPTNAFVPSIVTPLREVAPRGVRQTSRLVGEGDRRRASRVRPFGRPGRRRAGRRGGRRRSIALGVALADGLGDPSGRSAGIVRTRSLEVDEDPTPGTGPDRRDRERPAVPCSPATRRCPRRRRSRRRPRRRPRRPGRPRRRRPRAPRPRGPATSIGRGTGAAGPSTSTPGWPGPPWNWDQVGASCALAARGVNASAAIATDAAAAQRTAFDDG